MSSKINKSLKRYVRTTGFKLAVWYTGFFLAGSLCVLGLAYFLLAASLKKMDRADIVTEFQKYEREYADGGLKNLISETQDGKGFGANRFYVRVIVPDGNVGFLAASADFSIFSPPLVGFPAAGENPRWDFVKADGDADVLELLSGRLPDGAVLQVGLNTDWRGDLLDNFQNIAFIVIVPAVLLALIGGAFLTNRALKPLRQLIETVKTIEAGDLAARAPVRGTGDELDEAGSLFNKMLDRISALVAGMREALDNVAHDLRTPMARLRAVAETALTEKTSAGSRGEALSDCLEESERVLALLNALMEVSEAETGVMKLKCEPVSLAGLAAEVGEIYGYAAEAKKIKVTVKAEAEITATCDRARVRQALGNLVDNAVKYSPEGTAVLISLTKEDGSAVFRVSDQGPGIPTEDIPHIWDRLYRGDASRHEKGMGLGLSLVRAVALAHGGDVDVDSKPGEGSIFTLRLPTA